MRNYMIRATYKSGWSHVLESTFTMEEALEELAERMEDSEANDNNVESWNIFTIE